MAVEAKTRLCRAVPLVLLLAILAGGCFSSSPTSSSLARRGSRTYTVARGDTLYAIARRYGVSVGRLIKANRISDPKKLRAGRVLVIPGGYRFASIPRRLGSSFDDGYPGRRPRRQFAWPIYHGIVSSGFGMRHGAMHRGVDIAARAGTPVHAAGAGKVIFAGRLRGYGNLIIVRHDRTYTTVYAHNRTNLVGNSEHVIRGQRIGTVGTTGRTTGANLHFEVRRNNVARNPLAYLPPPSQTAGISFAAGGGS